MERSSSTEEQQSAHDAPSPMQRRNSRVLARHQARMAAKRIKDKGKISEEGSDAGDTASGPSPRGRDGVDERGADVTDPFSSNHTMPVPPRSLPPAPPPAPPPQPVPAGTSPSDAASQGIPRQRSGQASSPLTPLQEDVTMFLSRLNLGQYAERFEAEGYDDMEVIRDMTPSQFESMTEAIEMKRGHQLKLRKALEVDGANSTTQSPATPTTPLNRQSFQATPVQRSHPEKSPTNRASSRMSQSPAIVDADQHFVGARAEERLPDRYHGDTPRGNWKQGEVIGRGAFGQVFKGLWTGRGVVIAIKELYFDKEQKKQLLLLRKEIDMLRQMKHENIVTYLGGEEQLDGDSSKLYIFCEWVAGGSVQGMLDRYGKFDEDMCKRYATGALKGLRYLHEHLGTPVIHRDIKPANVLVTPDGVAKLADFGAAHFLDNSLGQTAGGGSSLAGTPYFMAPETIDQRNVGRRSDVWSFGGFVLNMMTGRPPWKLLDLRSPWALFEHVRSSQETPLDVELRLGGSDPQGLDLGFSKALTSFLQQCFARDFNERPYAKDIDEDPWIQSLVTMPLGPRSGETIGRTIAGIEACLEEVTLLHRSASEDQAAPSREYQKPQAAPPEEASPSNGRNSVTPSSGAPRSSPSKTNAIARLHRRASKANSSPNTPSNQQKGSPAAAAAQRLPPGVHPSIARQRSISSESRTSSGDSPANSEASPEALKSQLSSERLSDGGTSTLSRDNSGSDFGDHIAASTLLRAGGGDTASKGTAPRTTPPGRKVRLPFSSEDSQNRLFRQKVKKNLATAPGPSASPSKVPSPRPMISLETVTGARDPGTSIASGDIVARPEEQRPVEQGDAEGQTVSVTIDLDAARFANSQRGFGALNRKEAVAKASAARGAAPSKANESGRQTQNVNND